MDLCYRATLWHFKVTSIQGGERGSPYNSYTHFLAFFFMYFSWEYFVLSLKELLCSINDSTNSYKQITKQNYSFSSEWDTSPANMSCEMHQWFVFQSKHYKNKQYIVHQTFSRQSILLDLWPQGLSSPLFFLPWASVRHHCRTHLDCQLHSLMRLLRGRVGDNEKIEWFEFMYQREHTHYYNYELNSTECPSP